MRRFNAGEPDSSAFFFGVPGCQSYRKDHRAMPPGHLKGKAMVPCTRDNRAMRPGHLKGAQRCHAPARAPARMRNGGSIPLPGQRCMVPGAIWSLARRRDFFQVPRFQVPFSGAVFRCQAPLGGGRNWRALWGIAECISGELARVGQADAGKPCVECE